MRKITSILLFLLVAISLSFAPGMECVNLNNMPPNGMDDMDDDNNNNNDDDDMNDDDDNMDDDDDNNMLSNFTKTNIDVHNGARIEAGDDIVAYGTGGFSGVDYIVPSAGDTSGRGIPNGNTYVAYGFAVTGKYIALVSNFQITIYNTESGTATSFSSDEIRMPNLPSGIYTPGHIQADGDYVVARSDNSTTDEKKVKYIDLSQTPPMVGSFDVDPTGSVWHIEVDAESMRVLAASGSTFYLYDLSNPSNAPQTFDIPAGINDERIFEFDGKYVLFQDDEVDERAWLLDVDTGSATLLTNNPAREEMALGGDKYGYYVDESFGVGSRSALGTLPGPGTNLAGPAGENQIDGGTNNNGFLGWGQQIDITPDGSYAFISGKGSIGSGEYLMYSSGGGSWMLFSTTDPADTYGLPGTDCHVAENLVAFKTGAGTTAGANTKVGYLILP